MKLNENFALRQVAGTWVAIPMAGTALDFTGIISLNDSGAMLWKTLEQGGDKSALVSALTAEYNVDEATAAADVEEFLNRLAAAGCLDA